MNRDFLRENRGSLVLAAGIFVSYLVLHIVFQRHELLAYDMYAYASFAEHYSEYWFHTIIPGQAHGLEIVSYPPLLFQFMALLSFIPLLDITAIYIFLMSIGVTAFSFSFYRLLNQLLDLEEKHRRWIVPLVAFSPGLLKFSLVHGQLPLVIGLVFGFLSASSFYRVLKGEDARVMLAVTLALTAYIHHFSLLIAVILVAVIALMNLQEFFRSFEQLLTPILVSAGVAFVGLYPMIIETLFGISQGVIFHGSRNAMRHIELFHQYLTSTYSVAILGLLLVFRQDERLHQVNLLALVFMTIGLGTLTPTAEILFGGMADFIVYDRFSLVSSLFLTGLIGFYLASSELEIGKIDLSRAAAAAFILVSLATLIWANSLHLDSYTGYGDFDAERTNTAIEYLNENASDEYLYMTIDHGLPVGEIRRNTDVPTLDTGYYQGRKHGLLPNRGKFDRLGSGHLYQVLDSSDNLSLKYVLTFNRSTDDWFSHTDWRREDLRGEASAWINPDAEKYEPELGEERYVFTTIPFMVLLASVFIILNRGARSRLEGYFRRAAEFATRFPEDISRPRLWILLLPLIAALPSLVTSGYPSGIDTPAHIFKPELMAQMIQQHGQVFRWTTEWYNGYPFMSMYPPLSVYLLYGLYELFGDITVGYNLVRLATITSLSGVMYLLSRNVADDKRVRVLTSAFAVFSYPVYSNLYTVGRLASAMSLPLYLFLVHLALRDDIFQKELSRGHVYLGAASAVLFLLHSMMAYLFIFTGIIFCLVYYRDVLEIGVKPLLVTFGLPVLACFPYIARLLQHLSITDPSWYVASRDFNMFEHLQRGFDITPPSYSGWLQVTFFSLGVLKLRDVKDRFFAFSLLNFGFFYTAFWARNFRSAFFLPMSRQFDLSRFEILFTVFGILVAAYGLDYFYRNYLEGLSQWRKTMVAAFLAVLLVLGSAPMFTQSMNWQPEFGGEIDELEFEPRSRAMGVDMRQWHTYLLWEMNVSNTFGWFNQANPNPLFTQSLQRSGGRWHGWFFVQDIGDPDYRENLMELSNTRYIVAAQGEWMDSTKKMQVKGPDPLTHPYNSDLMEQVEESDEFVKTHSSEHLGVYRLNRSMSYCEGVEPVWIQSDYRYESRQLLNQENMLPQIPVHGDDPGMGGKAEGVRCSIKDPYTRTIEVDEEGWVLLKESYYPFWERRDGEIYDGFGFMVMYIEDEAELKYRPRSLETLTLDDVKKALSG